MHKINLIFKSTYIGNEKTSFIGHITIFFNLTVINTVCLCEK